MARIRSIKPEFFRHEGLFEAEAESGLPLRIAFVSLWTVADREGRFKWRPRALKLDCLPYDDVDFSRVLDALMARGFVVRYETDGQQYGVIPSFAKHQVINNREAESDLPYPPESTREGRVEDAPTTRLVHAQVEGKGREGEEEIKPRSEGSGERVCENRKPSVKQNARHDQLRPLFDRFYEAFPRHKEPDGAFKAFRQVVAAGADPELLITAAIAFRRECATKGTDQKFIPYPASWLRSGGWRDSSEIDVPKTNGSITPSGVFVKAETPQWDAWDRHYRQTKGRGPPTNRDGGWYFPTEFPPGHDETMH